MHYKTRQEMIASLPQGLRCAELGVFAGDFARDIRRIMRPSKLYLVDPFEGTFTCPNQDGNLPETLHLPTVEQMLRREFSDVDQTSIVKEQSVSWLKTQPAASLDFLYIDTTHSYEQTTAELREARRVVRPGGWISGHDYHERFAGVIQAVTELGLPVQLTKDGFPSFLVVNA
jgi:ubiquinone/menaquinone biosynthesis C-methylase UbiE